MTFHIPQTVPFTPETGLRHISTTSVNHGTQGDKISNEQRTGLWWVWSNFQDLVLGKKTCGYLLYAKKMFCCNFLHLIPDIKKKNIHIFLWFNQSWIRKPTERYKSESWKTLIVSGLYLPGASSVALGDPGAGSLAWWNSRDAVALQLCWNAGDLCSYARGKTGVTEARLASDHRSVSFKGLPGHSLKAQESMRSFTPQKWSV